MVYNNIMHIFWNIFGDDSNPRDSQIQKIKTNDGNGGSAATQLVSRVAAMEDWLGSYLVEGFCIVEIDICNFIYIYIIYIFI